jgi:predicted transcriptional regulator with HTH domain
MNRFLKIPSKTKRELRRRDLHFLKQLYPSHQNEGWNELSEPIYF